MVVAPLLVRKMLVGPLATHVHLPNPTPGFNETSGDIVDGRTLVIVIVYCYSLSLELYIYYIWVRVPPPPTPQKGGVLYRPITMARGVPGNAGPYIHLQQVLETSNMAFRWFLEISWTTAGFWTINSFRGSTDTPIESLYGILTSI